LVQRPTPQVRLGARVEKVGNGDLQSGPRIALRGSEIGGERLFDLIAPGVARVRRDARPVPPLRCV
jgi:hypothetical protein